jgi:hypothetical protein
MGLKSDLVEFFKNEDAISEIAKPLYEKRDELTLKIVDAAIAAKAKDTKGMLIAPIVLKFKDDEMSYIVKPNYVKANGEVKSVVFKVSGNPLFTISKKKIK